MLLCKPLSSLPSVGTLLTMRLRKQGVQSVFDLLLHLPTRYQDRTRCLLIAQLTVGMQVWVTGKVVQTQITHGRRKILTVLLKDATGTLALRFFHFNSAMRMRFNTNEPMRVYGEVHQGQFGLEMIHPECYRQGQVDTGSTAAAEQGLLPIYPAIQGFKQNTLRRLVKQALRWLDGSPVEELLPLSHIAQLPALLQALHTIHFPPCNTASGLLQNGKHPAYQRLILEELLAYQLALLSAQAKITHYHSCGFPVNVALKQRFLSLLPFQLTPAQQRVVTEIEADLAKTVPMTRLVQGDVGSGKTLVAACSALPVLSQGYQVVLMAPTDLLVEQHVERFKEWFTPLGFTVGRLGSHISAKMRRSLLAAIAEGKISLIVGTHALFQHQVEFIALGLAIIDEQHRFGVHQRLLLWEKGIREGSYPHQLIMTATPIPRTLAMNLYAGLQHSMMEGQPIGRQPVTTIIVPESRRDEVVRRIEHACCSGKQAYWICPLVEHSTLLDAHAAEQTAEDLRTRLPTLKIGLVHGRMKVAKRQQVMRSFRDRTLQLLVATTVIEVGIDVPNATLMVIEDPDRFGLAQMHQLRGRIGRGKEQAYCVLLYRPPLSQQAKKRLSVIRASHDGFFIAQRDLEIRGPGELLGTRQTGEILFRVANLLRDQALLPQVEKLAYHMQKKCPRQAAALIERWFPDYRPYSHV